MCVLFQMLNCCIEHKKKREQLHKGYTGELDSPSSSPYRGPSTSQVSRSLSQEDPINISQSDNSAGPSVASADKSSKTTGKSRKSSAINKTGSLRVASSGESSDDDDEFFECNDDDNNQSSEKDEDTSAENQTTETLQQMRDGDGTQLGDNEDNQSETDMECDPVNTSQIGSLTESLTDSQIQEFTGTEQRPSIISNVSEASDSAFKESYSHKPEGRMALFQELKLINCDDKMYIPITQEPAPMTEDMLEEHAEVLAK